MKKLSDNQKRRLEYAFENQEADFIRLGDICIAVNAQYIPNFQSTETKGAWSIGVMK